MITEKTQCTIRAKQFVEPCKGLENLSETGRGQRKRGIYPSTVVSVRNLKPMYTYYAISSGRFKQTAALVMFCPACGVRIDGPALLMAEREGKS